MDNGGRGTVFDTVFKKIYEIPRPPKQPAPRSVKIITAWGETKSMTAWSKDPRCRVDHVTLSVRLRATKRKWEAEEAISTPAADRFVGRAMRVKAKLHKAFNTSKTVEEWAKDARCEVGVSLLRARVAKGIPIAFAMKRLRS